MRETAEFAAFITATESAAVALGDVDAKALSQRLIPVYCNCRVAYEDENAETMKEFMG
jgi:hypothetical protein